jgi:hypothetical protein
MANPCPPELVLVSINANESGCRSCVPAPVFVVLFCCGGSQVRPPVVRLVVIDVIHMMRGPFACHIKPSQPMSEIELVVNLDSGVRPGCRASGVSANGALTPRDAPCKRSGMRVVVGDGAHALGRKIVASHEALQLLIGQRLASVGSTARASLFYASGR